MFLNAGSELPHMTWGWISLHDCSCLGRWFRFRIGVGVGVRVKVEWWGFDLSVIAIWRTCWGRSHDGWAV